VRGRIVALSVVAATVAVAAGTAGAVVAVRAGEALPGVRVAGTDVSGLGRPQLRSTIERLAAERTRGTLGVDAAGVRSSVNRSLAVVDVEGTLQDALAAGRSGYALAPVVGPLTGAGDRTVALDLGTDTAGIRARLDAIARAVDRPVSQGDLTITTEADTATAAPVLPVAGRRLDRAGALAAVEQGLSRPVARTVQLPVQTTAPTATDAQVQAVAGAATAALSEPYLLTAGPSTLTVTPTELAPLLSMSAANPPALAVDSARLSALVKDKAGPLATTPTSARFDVAGPASAVDSKGDLTWTPKAAEVRVQPGTKGREVDVPATVTALTGLVSDAGHTGPLPVTVSDPPLSTEQARAAGVQNLIGTFTTYFTPGQPRASNIRRIAQIVDGTYVASGERFSLNKTAGRRTLSRGFVADGAIVDGELTDEVGGGVSQFATTLFNAAFFAGLPIPEHKPHSFYISRYPAGRESTVYFGAIDVKMVNNTGHGLLVRTRSTAGSVTVELYGDNGGRRVSSTTEPRSPTPQGGFVVRVTRSITGGDGKDGRRVFTTRYDPVPKGE